MKKFFFSCLFTGAFGIGAFAQVTTPTQVVSPQPVQIQQAPGPAATPVDPAAPALPPTTIVFEEVNHDFGNIDQGAVASFTYKFKNTGSNPAKLESVKPGCGCTASDYSKEEVPPGGEGFVKLDFNSAYKSGMQSKSATVIYNGDPKVITLSFKANILVPTPPADGTVTPAPGTPVTPTPGGH